MTRWMRQLVSTYVVQQESTAICPMCGQRMYLLCDRKGNSKKPWFYICWTCRNIVQVGIGPVTTIESARTEPDVKEIIP